MNCEKCTHPNLEHGRHGCGIDGCKCYATGTVFPCSTCGGIRGHVSYCEVEQEEHRRQWAIDGRRRRIYQERQETLRQSVIGRTVLECRIDSLLELAKKIGMRI